jgi:hypothetical protein
VRLWVWIRSFAIAAFLVALDLEFWQFFVGVVALNTAFVATEFLVEDISKERR